MDIGVEGQARVKQALEDVAAAHRAVEQASVQLDTLQTAWDEDRAADAQKLHRLQAETNAARLELEKLDDRICQELKARDQKHATELNALRRRVAEALRRGISETYGEIGYPDPFEMEAKRRRQISKLRARYRSEKSHTATLEGKHNQLENELESLRDELQSARSLNRRYERELKHRKRQILDVPERTRQEMLARLVKRLGVREIANLLSDAAGADRTALAADVLPRFAGYLGDMGITVVHSPGQHVLLESEEDLTRFELPLDEQFQLGPAETTHPGFMRGRTVLIKARIRYLEDSADGGTQRSEERDNRRNEPRADTPEGCKDATGVDPEPAGAAEEEPQG